MSTPPDTRILVDVSELVDRPGTSHTKAFEAHVPDLEVGLGRVADDGAVFADLLFESLVEGILVTGEVTGRFELECSRCLREFSQPFVVTVSEVYSYPDQPEIDEGFAVEDNQIDLEPMIRDEVLLAVPPNPLHDQACKGLCAVCGQDLNVADCGHAHQATDIRWEPLRKLMQPEPPPEASN